MEGVEPAPFIAGIKSSLGNNLPDNLIVSLATILAIDYTKRLKKQPTCDRYISKCVERLRNYLKRRVIVEEDFALVMSLFVIAITGETETNGELNKRKKNSEILIEGVINTWFGHLLPEEFLRVKETLKLLLDGAKAIEIINFVSLEPKLFLLIIDGAYKEKAKQSERMDLIALNLNKVMHQTQLLSQAKNNIKLQVGKLALATSLFISASAGVLLGGAALPVLLIPAFAASARLAPFIENKIGEKIAQNASTVKDAQSKLRKIAATLQTPGLAQGHVRDQRAHVRSRTLLSKTKINVKSQGVAADLLPSLPKEKPKNIRAR